MKTAKELLEELKYNSLKAMNVCDKQVNAYPNQPAIVIHAKGCKTTLETVLDWTERNLKELEKE